MQTIPIEFIYILVAGCVGVIGFAILSNNSARKLIEKCSRYQDNAIITINDYREKNDNLDALACNRRCKKRRTPRADQQNKLLLVGLDEYKKELYASKDEGDLTEGNITITHPDDDEYEDCTLKCIDANGEEVVMPGKIKRTVTDENKRAAESVAEMPTIGTPEYNEWNEKRHVCRKCPDNIDCAEASDFCLECQNENKKLKANPRLDSTKKALEESIEKPTR